MNKPLSLQVVGGLGNQLYGLAAGIVIANHLQRELELDFGLVRFGANMSRSPEIERIDLGVLTEQIISKNTQRFVHKYIYEKVRRKVNHTLPDALADRLVPNLLWKKRPDYIDTEEAMSTQLEKISKNTNTLGGYFTSFAWADKAIELGFPSELNPLSPSRTYQNYFKSLSQQSISLHIRLGDYVSLPNSFPIVTEEFYFSALDAINYSLGEPINLFTDSVDEVRLRFPNLMQLENLHVIDPLNQLNSVETMAFMSRHNRIITSNSTFSSWAAWFSQSDAIVTPIPHHKHNWVDTLPESWTRMKINS